MIWYLATPEFHPSPLSLSLSSFKNTEIINCLRDKGSRVGGGQPRYPSSLHQRRKDRRRELRLNHGSRPLSRPSAFIFARLVASCAEINSPLPLSSPLQRSSRAQTPTECPISKGSCRILHLVLPSPSPPFSFRFGNNALPGHLSQPGCSADESRCWRNWDKRQVLGSSKNFNFFFFESIQGGIRKFFD